MPAPKPLISSAVVIVTLVLAAQTSLYYGLTKSEKAPAGRPLAQFPDSVGDWVKTEEGIVDAETLGVLKADDTLNRVYGGHKARLDVNLFIAAFRSQRTGAVPHSPKNCLPGSGWSPLTEDRVLIPLPGRGPIEVNRYIIQKGDSKSFVLYWYQSRDRAVAGEFKAKLYTMVDAVRENRTDTALIRVIIPLNSADSNERAQAAAEDFIRSFYRPLRGFLPA